MEQNIDTSLAKVTEQLSESDHEALLCELEGGIERMIAQRFDALVQILYRMDIDETRLRTLLSSPGETPAARIIAHLLIERQLQKLRTRQQFKPDPGIAEEDAW